MRFTGLLVLALGSCGSLVAPQGAYRIAPVFADPAMRELAACAGTLPLVRAVGTVEFYAVPGGAFSVDGIDDAVGYGRGNRIYIAADLIHDVKLWAHELLHVTRGLPGRTATDHPPAFWACGLDPRQM